MGTPKKIEAFLKKYTDNKTLRASVSAIPYIGGALDILMTSDIQKRSLERYQNFLDELKKQFENLEENKIDYSYLNSEEFYDLFVQTSSLVVKTRLNEKIKAYSSILTSSLIFESKSRIKPEDIVAIIEGLTENDIILIRIISEYLESESIKKINSDIVFDSKLLSDIFNEYTKEFIFIGLLSLVKNSLIIKHPVKSAPIPNLSYSVTPNFNIVRDFLIK